MKREQKDYIGRRFELEPTKLTKLLRVMHEKLAGLADPTNTVDTPPSGVTTGTIAVFTEHPFRNRTAGMQSVPFTKAGFEFTFR
jgi:hypothetical protein